MSTWEFLKGIVIIVTSGFISISVVLFIGVIIMLIKGLIFPKPQTFEEYMAEKIELDIQEESLRQWKEKNS